MKQKLIILIGLIVVVAAFTYAMIIMASNDLPSNISNAVENTHEIWIDALRRKDTAGALNIVSPTRNNTYKFTTAIQMEIEQQEKPYVDDTLVQVDLLPVQKQQNNLVGMSVWKYEKKVICQQTTIVSVRVEDDAWLCSLLRILCSQDWKVSDWSKVGCP